MKTYKITLFCLALSVALSGCGKPDNPDPGTNPGTDPGIDPDAPYFTASLPDEWVFNMDPGAMSWPVETNITDWTATSSESWCKPTPMTDQLWLDIEDYDARDENGYERFDPPRTCTVTVKAGSVYSKTIQIVQQTHPYIETLDGWWDGKPLELSSDGETRDIFIRNNVWEWTPSSNDDWLTVSRIDNQTLRLSSTARPASQSDDRITTVKIWMTSDQTYYITFPVKDAKADLGGEDAGYGDHTDWD